MVHGPCGDLNPTALCIEVDKAIGVHYYTKGFPI
jgi:hypothetical protein